MTYKSLIEEIVWFTIDEFSGRSELNKIIVRLKREIDILNSFINYERENTTKIGSGSLEEK